MIQFISLIYLLV
ncbi:hypothetical protein BpHYR1_029814 [Brachionus plicatilis]|uniref:Uncharacterized protein n=1 Tax=Brachionus plicatilis TaxID=10195 RepID=A0A3M7SEW6_BRAPC|nr:hypothetical protein BpHYR1_029814 [Brachionus plicatilis]